jgi:hypothetical protein
MHGERNTNVEMADEGQDRDQLEDIRVETQEDHYPLLVDPKVDDDELEYPDPEWEEIQQTANELFAKYVEVED